MPQGWTQETADKAKGELSDAAGKLIKDACEEVPDPFRELAVVLETKLRRHLMRRC